MPIGRHRQRKQRIAFPGKLIIVINPPDHDPGRRIDIEPFLGGTSEHVGVNGPCNFPVYHVATVVDPEFKQSSVRQYTDQLTQNRPILRLCGCGLCSLGSSPDSLNAKSDIGVVG